MFDGISQAISDLKGSWDGMGIYWGNNTGKDDIRSHVPMPFVEFAGETFVPSRRLTDYNVFDNQGADVWVKSNISDEAEIIAKGSGAKGGKKKGLIIKSLTETVKVHSALVKEHEDYLEYLYSTVASDTKKQPRGGLGSELSQWIIVKVAPKPDDKGPIKAKLWAFLQPRGFDGETPVRTTDDNSTEQIPESRRNATHVQDFPRSGWSEYNIDFTEGTVETVRYSDGKKSAKAADKLDYQFFEVKRGKVILEQVLKLKIRLTNDVTAGDLERKAKRLKRAKEAHAAINKNAPFDEKKFEADSVNIEAGCWLKVWMRNEGLNWGVDPSDDETNLCAFGMDRKDPSGDKSGKGRVTFLNQFPFRNHGFLRGRLADGRGIQNGKIPEVETIIPFYFALVSASNVVDLKQLVKLFEDVSKKEDTPFMKQIASTGIAVTAEVGLFLIIRKYMERVERDANALQRIGGESDDKFAKRKEKYVLDRAEKVTKAFTFFQIHEHLGAYAIDGFQHFPASGLEEIAKSKANALKTFTKIFSAAGDIALSTSPTVMKNVVLKNLEARKKAMDDFLAGGTKPEFKRVKLSDLAQGKGINRVKSDDLDVIDVEIPLGSVKLSKTMPEPFGYPIVTPVGLLGFFAITLDFQADLTLAFEMIDKEDHLSLFLGLKIPVGTNIHIGMRLDAPWAILTRPQFMAADADGRLARDAAEQERNNMSAEIQSGVQAGAHGGVPFLNALQTIQELINVNAYAKVGYSGDGLIGVKNFYSEKAKKRVTELAGMKKQELGLRIKGDCVVGFNISLFNWERTPFDMELLNLTDEAITIPLKGKIFGTDIPEILGFRKPFAKKVGKNLLLEGEYDETFEPDQKSTRVAKPHQTVYWGASKKIKMRLAFSSMANEAPGAKLICLASSGAEDFVSNWGFGAEPIMELDMKENPVKEKSRWMEADFCLDPKELGGKMNSTLETFAEENLKHQLVALNIFAKCKGVERPLKQPKSFFVFKPRLKDYSAEFYQIAGRRRIKLRLDFGHYFGEGVWVRIYKDGLIDRAVQLGDLEWTFFAWSNSFSEFPTLNAVLDFPLERVNLKKGDKFWVDVALLPCDGGMFNEKLCRANAITFS